MEGLIFECLFKLENSFTAYSEGFGAISIGYSLKLREPGNKKMRFVAKIQWIRSEVIDGTLHILSGASPETCRVSSEALKYFCTANR